MSDAHRMFVRAAAASTADQGLAQSGCPVSQPGSSSVSTSSSSATSPAAGCSSDSIRTGQASCSYASNAAATSTAGAAEHSARINMDVVPNAPTTGRSSSSSSLSMQREKSSIPMAPVENMPKHQQGSTEDVWVYPSEQQFFNAMKRKGWDPSEADMSKVVAIHNTVNERAWQHILAWEALHACDCANPRLKRFQGKPNEFSPKARLLNFLGFKLPFDRHDWVVDRCGKEVRYIIDFYSGAPQPGVPASMHLDVRPALDSVGAIYDRLKMQMRWVASGRWQYE